MLRQRAGLAKLARPRQQRLFLLRERFALCDRCLDVFQCECQLIGRQPRKLLALCPVAVIDGFLQLMMNVLVERLQSVALGQRGIAFADQRFAFGQRFRGPCAQALDIVRQGINRGLHVESRAQLPVFAMRYPAAESIGHSFIAQLPGARFWACACASNPALPEAPPAAPPKAASPRQQSWATGTCPARDAWRTGTDRSHPRTPA